MTDHPKKEPSLQEKANIFARGASNAWPFMDNSRAALQTLINGVQDMRNGETIESFRQHSPEEFKAELNHQQKLTLEAKAKEPKVFVAGVITGSIMVGLAAVDLMAVSFSKGAMGSFYAVTNAKGAVAAASIAQSTYRFSNHTTVRAEEELHTEIKPTSTPKAHHKGHTKSTTIT